MTWKYDLLIDWLFSGLLPLILALTCWLPLNHEAKGHTVLSWQTCKQEPGTMKEKRMVDDLITQPHKLLASLVFSWHLPFRSLSCLYEELGDVFQISETVTSGLPDFQSEDRHIHSAMGCYPRLWPRYWVLRLNTWLTLDCIPWRRSYYQNQESTGISNKYHDFSTTCVPEVAKVRKYKILKYIT